MPHLFIIVDEFAELKREEEGFLKELISVAQVGRSLGVHLILATQKPEGTVDENIWSNSRFRICLRVQDSKDSMYMLHKSDAAYLTQTGRAYLQVGNNEIYELFQSGWSGAVYEENDGINGSRAQMLDETGKAALVGNYAKRRNSENAVYLEKKVRTQLTATVRYLSQIAKKEGYHKPQQLWLPVLPESITLEKLEKYIKEMLNGQNELIDSKIYAQKISGTNIFRSKIEIPIGLWDDPENQQQKPLVLSFTEKGNYAVCGMPMSGRSTLIQTTVYGLIHRYTPDKLNIYMIVTGSGMKNAEFPMRMRDNFHQIICLELPDRIAYGECLGSMKDSVLPEKGIRGRGLVQINGRNLEFQTALALEAADDYQRGEEIRRECVNLNNRWTGKQARQIPKISQNPEWNEFQGREDVQRIFENDRYLPVGYDTISAEIFSLDLLGNYCFLISGKSRTGKHNCLKAMMNSAKHKGGELIIIEFNGWKLKKVAEDVQALYIDSYEEYMDFMSRFVPVFQSRNRLKKSLISQGLEEDAVYTQMSKEKPYYIFIADLVEYTKLMHSEQAALRTDEIWKFHMFEKISEAENFLEEVPLLDIISWDVTMKKSVPSLEKIRRDYRQSYLMVVADGSISPMVYLRPGIMPSSLLLKPVSRENLVMVVNEMMDAFTEKFDNKDVPESFVIESREGKQYIPLNQIYYIEAREKKIFIRTKQEE